MAQLETILTTQDSKLQQTWSLVLTAVEIPHQVIQVEETYLLLVQEQHIHRALYEIETYIEENRNWPPKPHLDEVGMGIQPPTIILMGALAFFHGVTGNWSEHSPWFSLGAGNSEAILQQGEWYRLVTPLTLHADAVHLMGNCFLGGFLLHFFCRSMGTGLALFSMLITAIVGNWINVKLHGVGHLFVGFSTAVFALIGMMSIHSYHTRKKVSGFHFLTPLMAGAALLAMLGSSGERTDLGAHLFGLLAGLITGMLLCTKTIQRLRKSQSLQGWLFFLSICLLYFSWSFALRDSVY